MLIQEEHIKQQHHTMQLLTFPKKKRQVKTIYHSKSKSVPQSSSRGEERVSKAARSGTINISKEALQYLIATPNVQSMQNYREGMAFLPVCQQNCFM